MLGGEGVVAWGESFVRGGVVAGLSWVWGVVVDREAALIRVRRAGRGGMTMYWVGTVGVGRQGWCKVGGG